jgi:N-acylglucosamine 2-epimerase
VNRTSISNGLHHPASLRSALHAELYEHVMPFWLDRAIDPKGGLNTCFADDGTLLSRDKWLWSQWRAVWVFSRLFRITHEQRYLDIADQIRQFCCSHGWHPDGGWRLCVDASGAEVRGRESIYVDGFAIYALAEFILATGDADAQTWARRTASHVLTVLDQPHDRVPHFPYPVPPGMRMHGIPMIFSLSFHTLAEALGDERCARTARELSDDVMNRFCRPDRGLILERIRDDGTEAPGPEGTAVVPGHAIESMWFQMDIAGRYGPSRTIDRAVDMIRRHLELGWDDQYGGLRLAVDADGRTEVGWPFADVKLWWPHTEAMVAVVRAYEQTGAEWCVEWYERIHAYAFTRFPDRSVGEWRQRLDRQGHPITEVVALPVKDPFHLPRALIHCIEALDRIQDGGATPVRSPT